MRCSCYRLVYLLLLTVLCFKDAQADRTVKIRVPQAIISGKDAALQCSVDYEGEQLYSLKWYREGLEFYRYTPQSRNPVMIFQVAGINVKLSESIPERIILEKVSRNVSGIFICEITTEVPSFYTVLGAAKLKVVDIPKRELSLTGLKDHYYPGEIVRANCTSDYSYPPANITWQVNGHRVQKQVMTRRILGYYDRSTVVSQLRYRLTKDIQRDKIKIQCSADIYDVYHRSVAFSIKVSDSHDWPPTTKAPTTSTEEYYEMYDGFEIASTNSPFSTLWFFPFSGASTLASPVPMLLLCYLCYFISIT
ncbi:uncharacterized protein [Euwallacea fornicatus]|uniref:uncharacterized protein n=1 Tax=Euwallacea fornicatus TaxID=995702 RepID=UPI00338F2CAE